jgi:hypothetical protein
MLHIEPLEIDGHILDKVEAKHGITLGEKRTLVYRRNGMSGEAGKGYTNSLVRQWLDGISWW